MKHANVSTTPSCFLLTLLLLVFYALASDATLHKLTRRNSAQYGSSSADNLLLHVNTQTLRIEDVDGRERYFHGVNVVYKKEPWYPILDHFDAQNSFSQEDMQILQDLGLNVVRLGVQWPGVEPTRGQYNETYLKVISNLVEQMREHEIMALLEFHQDVFSEKFCGEGVPAWAAQPSPKARGFPYPQESKPYRVDNTTGFPLPEECNRREWSDYYLTEAQATAVQNLYDNYDGLLDAFAGFWKKVASTFKQQDSNIIGYELINEPWCGNFYAEPSLLIPGVADRKNLQRVYDRLNTAIREVDQDHLVLFEPVTWDDFGCGFLHAPGGLDFSNRSVLSYHYYKPPDISVKSMFISREYDRKRLQVGGFLTEFAINSDPAFTKELLETVNACDDYKQSWIGWEYKPYYQITGWGWCLINPDGSVNTTLAKRLSRTYPHAVAGYVTSMSFDSELTSTFKLQYQIRKSCKEPTVIYFNYELHYANGYQVVITPEASATWSSPKRNFIHVTHTAEAKDGETLSISIAPVH